MARAAQRYRRRRHQGRPHRLRRAARRPAPPRERIDAHGKAVAPGFVNMLAHPEESLLVDGRALSDLRQGVTLEVLGEDSMGPLTAEDEGARAAARGGHQVRHRLEHARGVPRQARAPRHHARTWPRSSAPARCAPTCSAKCDVQPTPAQLEQMRQLVHQAMEEGAVGVTTALIYAPNTYAKTPELIALASEAARCGGIYSAHMRSEGDRLIEAVQETIDISTASGAPAEIFHLKVAGRAQLAQDRPAHPDHRAARAPRACTSAPTCTCTRPGRRAWMRPCRRGCRTAGSRPGSSA